jgi:hypothetical protein
MYCFRTLLLLHTNIFTGHSSSSLRSLPLSSTALYAIFCRLERLHPRSTLASNYNINVSDLADSGLNPSRTPLRAPHSAPSCTAMSDRNIDLESTQVQPTIIPTDSPPPSPPIADATNSGASLIYPCVRHSTFWSIDLKVPRKREREVSLEPATPKSDVLVHQDVSVCEPYLHYV